MFKKLHYWYGYSWILRVIYSIFTILSFLFFILTVLEVNKFTAIGDMFFAVSTSFFGFIILRLIWRIE